MMATMIYLYQSHEKHIQEIIYKQSIAKNKESQFPRSTKTLDVIGVRRGEIRQLIMIGVNCGYLMEAIL